MNIVRNYNPRKVGAAISGKNRFLPRMEREVFFALLLAFLISGTFEAVA